MPAHMDGAVAPALPWAAKVSHKKAPGAMSAIAFIVRPVRPKVGFIVTSALSAIDCLLRISPSIPEPESLSESSRLPTHRSTLFFRRYVRDQPQQQRRLRLCARAVILKEGFIRPVGAELAACHQPARDLIFTGQSEFLDGLRGSRGEPVLIVEKLQAPGHGILLADGVARRAGHADPGAGAGADVLVPPVIEINVRSEIVG